MEYPKLPVEKDRRRKLSLEQIEEMKKMRESGMSYRAVGILFGVSKTAVSYHCSEQAKKDEINQQRYELLKEQEIRDPEFKEKRHREKLKNQAELLERSEEKRKHKSYRTYKWKKKKYHSDPEFREKTKERARQSYFKKSKN